ncbi:MAG TPA: hypothetical protein VG145_04945 [Xanthobacteraceae bacterium]|nr:hypothetical protein [Xanthobacteraceae bacterium]
MARPKTFQRSFRCHLKFARRRTVHGHLNTGFSARILPRLEPNRGAWRCGRMTQARKSEVPQRPCQSLADEWNAPVFGFLGVLLAGAAGLFFVLFSVSHPTVYPNPGVTAYVAPPATRLVPLARQSTAPELADLPVVDPPSPLTAFAKAQPDDQPAKSETRPPARKRPRAEPSAYSQRSFGFAQPQRSFGFAQPWNFGSQGPSNTRMRTGGPKSWF